MQLNYYLLNEPETFLKCIETWDKSLYNAQNITNAVSERLKEKNPDNVVEILLNSLATL